MKSCCVAIQHNNTPKGVLKSVHRSHIPLEIPTEDVSFACVMLSVLRDAVHIDSQIWSITSSLRGKNGTPGGDPREILLF